VKDKPEIAGILLQLLMAGYTRVKNNPDLVGTRLMAGDSCFVGDKPEIAYHAPWPVMAGYSCRVENKLELVGTRLMAG
jgi:hypothetical protein